MQASVPLRYSTSFTASGWFKQNCPPRGSQDFAGGNLEAIGVQTSADIGSWQYAYPAGNTWSGPSPVGILPPSDPPASPQLIITASCASHLVVYRGQASGGLFFLSGYSVTPTLVTSTKTVGSPAFVESDYGDGGGARLEVVAPLATGGLSHWSTSAGSPGSPWTFDEHFAGEEKYDAVAMIESSWGHLEVIARTTGGNLHEWYEQAGVWYDDGLMVADGSTISDISGPPGLIQSTYGATSIDPKTIGNFELVTPLASGGVAEWWRDNNTAGFPWHINRIADQGAWKSLNPPVFVPHHYTNAAIIEDNRGFAGGIYYVVGQTTGEVNGWSDVTLTPLPNTKPGFSGLWPGY
ncbi:hypothetical protein GCM10009765_37890 [Fodinicola feengrottensis]|uniref:Uncharacterized protein n=1 Tax=Fodinicola feengrottensis TaxID=435914 RepID=A0ABP4TAT8_9ACTN